MSDLGPRLVREGLIAREDLALALQAQAREGRTVTFHLLAIGAIPEDTLVRYFCSRFPVEELRPEHTQRIPAEVLDLIPREMASEFRVLPIARSGDTLTLAMADPSDTHALDEVRFYTGCQVVPFVARESILTRALEECYGVADTARASAVRLGTEPEPEPAVPLTRKSGVPDERALLWGTGDASGRAEQDTVHLLTKKRPDPPPRPTEPSPPLPLDPASALPLTARAPHDAPQSAKVERHDTVEDLSTAILSASDLAWEAAAAAEQTGRLEVLAPKVRPRLDTQPIPAVEPPSPPPEQPAAVPAASTALPAEPPPSPFPPAMDEPPPRRRTVPLTPPPRPAVKRVESQPPAQASPAPAAPVPGVHEAPSAPSPPAPGPAAAVTSMEAILEAPDRDAAIGHALDAMLTRADRAVFFVVKRGVAEGWDARGEGLDRDRVRNLWVPLSSPSVLKDAVASRATFLGPPPDTISNGMLLATLGGRPGRVLLCPVLVRSLAVGVLYADSLGPDADVAHAEAIADALRSAMERIILAQKASKEPK